MDVLGCQHRNLGEVNDLPSALKPTAGPLGSAVCTLFHRVFHLLGERHAGTGKAVRMCLAWFPGLGRLPFALPSYMILPAAAAPAIANPVSTNSPH